MNDLEKSVLLAQAMGWQIDDPTEPMDWRDENGEGVSMTLVANIMSKGYRLGFSFYDPANLALAKKAILWGYNFIPAFQKWLHKDGCALAVLIGAGGYGFALDRLVLELNIEAEVDGSTRT